MQQLFTKDGRKYKYKIGNKWMFNPEFVADEYAKLRTKFLYVAEAVAPQEGTYE
jgi:hypothetical protein